MEHEYPYTRKLFGYAKATSLDKVKCIMKNFERFPNLIAGYEATWKIIVQAELRHSHDADRGELGVRVQMSGISDPTMDSAVLNTALDQAQSENDLRHILNGTDNPSQHITEKMIIMDMQDDFMILKNQIHTLGVSDEERLLHYLQRESMTLQELADESHLQLASYKKMIYGIKKTVIASAVEYIDLKYNILERGTHVEE